MRRVILLAAFALVCGTGLRAGPTTVPLWINTGTIFFTNAAQIDATAVVNLGTFEFATPLPFDFQNTLYFTNRGRMAGYPGFRFDYTDDFGVRRPASVFVNEGEIDRGNGIVLAGESILGTALGYSNLIAPTSISIAATNVRSAGLLTVQNAGTLVIEGKDVDLSRGGLEVMRLTSYPGANTIWVDASTGQPVAFEPDYAIHDYVWGAGLHNVNDYGAVNSQQIIRFLPTGILGTSPTEDVYLRNGGANPVGSRMSTFAPFNYNTTFAYTNAVGWTNVTLTNVDGTISFTQVPTNITRQAVVVGLLDTNLTVSARFAPSFTPMPLRSVAVQIAMTTTNVALDTTEEHSIYFIDKLGSETNTLLLTNFTILQFSQRPMAYEVWRDGEFLPFEWLAGSGPNSEVTPTILYEQGFSNVFITNLYAFYDCGVDYLQARPPEVPGANPTNLPGRVNIVADNVDLSNTRIQGMGAVTITTKHLKTSVGARVDVERLGFDLASTNGLLTVKDLAKAGTDRMRGELTAWSGVWTNSSALILSNWFIDPTTNYFAPITNAYDIELHVLLLDAQLTHTQQVVVYSFVTRSTNVVVEDNMFVNGKLLIDADSFTLNGELTTLDELNDWTYVNAPNLLYMTNTGTLTVPNTAHYGSDFPDGRRLKTFVNRGTLRAAGQSIAADYYENAGTTQSDNDLTVSAGSGKLEGGRDNSASGDLQYYAGDLKLRNYTMVADRGVYLSVTNNLTDTGGGANNEISVRNGFHLLRKPQTGDLLGTTFQTTAPRFASVLHTWAAEDRGATAAGFANNAAIGRLALDVFAGSELRFGGRRDPAGGPFPGTYALYVDYLDVQAASLVADIESGLSIEDNLTIYFATSNMDPEELDGKCNGRLRWVRSYAGPNSGVDVALRDGRIIKANLSLVDSTTIDSDGDGLANGFDDYPFDGVRLAEIRVTQQDPLTILVSWDGAANTVYQVEATAGLASPDWQNLGTVTGGTNGQVLTFTNTLPDSILPEGSERYYRVRYEP